MANYKEWIAEGGRRHRRIYGEAPKWIYFQDIFNDDGNWTGGRVGAGFMVGTSRSVSVRVFMKHRGYPAPQTQAEADRIKQEMIKMSPDEAKIIYKIKYWDEVQGDKINSQLIANMLADMKSSAGGNGIKPLQKALNQLGAKVEVDGEVGSQTLAAINAQVDKDQAALYNQYRENMLAYYQTVKKDFRDGLISSLNEDYPPRSNAEIRKIYPLATSSKNVWWYVAGVTALSLLVFGVYLAIQKRKR